MELSSRGLMVAHLISVYDRNTMGVVNPQKSDVTVESNLFNGSPC